MLGYQNTPPLDKNQLEKVNKLRACEISTTRFAQGARMSRQSENYFDLDDKSNSVVPISNQIFPNLHLIMASWNDKHLGDRLDKCPVCLCNLNKKKMTAHVSECYKRNKASMDSIGVVKCPMSSEHILPISFLNHHLEGNCQEVQNQMRPYYQGAMPLHDFPGAPPDFLPDYPDKYLNKHNRDLLYLLHNKLFGSFLKDRPANEPDFRQANTARIGYDNSNDVE